MIPLKNPTLYSEQGTEALPACPALRAVVSSSGHISFPPQHYGCQLTGDTGDQLRDVLITGRGRLHAGAVVHIHRLPSPATPFTVVEVLMDDGVLVRGLMASGRGLPAAGTVLVTCLEEVKGEDGNLVRDLRFVEAATSADSIPATHSRH